MNKIVVNTPGRISLAGEKLDWLCRGSGITCALDGLFLTIIIEESDNSNINVFSKCKNNIVKTSEFKSEINNINNKYDYIKAVLIALKKYNINLKGGLNIIIESNIPQGLGLSSSAALCTSLVAGISKFCNITLSKREIANIAYIAEKEILGIKCGQMDQYAVSFGGICKIDSSTIPARVKKLSNKLSKYSIILINPNKEIKTNEVNSIIQKRARDNDPLISNFILKTKRIVDYLSIYFNSEVLNIRKVGRLITDAHFLLSSIGVSNIFLDKIVKNTIEAGAYGSKLASGKGGIVFAIVDKELVDKVINKINYPNINIMVLRANSKGLYINN